ncbi:MAG: O-phosphoseryl-tRNA(Sec) selenium transferase [Candidatus Thorarchaeota archaeon]
MDIEKKFEELIPENMLRRGDVTLEAILGPIRKVFHQRKFMLESLSDFQIDLLLRILAALDTDKDPEAARVGEREARTASPLVDSLSAGFNHGIGRSGHITAPQPKAPGASLMQQIVNQIAFDALRRLGLSNIKSGMVLPLSTGMSLGLVASTLRKKYGISKIISPRIDHISPERGVSLVGLEFESTPTLLNGDAVEVDLDVLESKIQQEVNIGILATTTFFPPRVSDPVKEIAKLCQAHDVPLIVNNAYGVQSLDIMQSLQRAIDAGRVDMIVQSGDKNFLTPVGSSILVSPSEDIVEATAESYAGRATAAPLVQTLASLLSLGLERYVDLRFQQMECRKLLDEKLIEISEAVGQRVLDTSNPIAAAMTLDGIDVASLGGKLYNRRVTGPRAIAAGEYGSCIDNYPSSYIVMNAAIGATKSDIEAATTKLYKELSD